MPRTRSIKGMKVNRRRCHSCPFNRGGCQEVRASVERRCMTLGSQLCHGTDNKTLCRGARDHQMTIFYRLGVLKEQTDACWDETLNEMERKRG